ncbi:hypothetical protein BaRGS_00016830 [Batillaria attramentaria]|uniref:Uncharacterized protein n=1 Tax=Batillaria attramentaria TaxID=370345 RepID=A0ABD0KXN9_9CAEN
MAPVVWLAVRAKNNKGHKDSGRFEVVSTASGRVQSSAQAGDGGGRGRRGTGKCWYHDLTMWIRFILKLPDKPGSTGRSCQENGLTHLKSSSPKRVMLQEIWAPRGGLGWGRGKPGVGRRGEDRVPPGGMSWYKYPDVWQASIACRRGVHDCWFSFPACTGPAVKAPPSLACFASFLVLVLPLENSCQNGRLSIVASLLIRSGGAPDLLSSSWKTFVVE